MGYPFGKYEFRKVPDTLRTNKTHVFLPLNELNMVFKLKISEENEKTREIVMVALHLLF